MAASSAVDTSAPNVSAPLPLALNVKLSLMMFLQYAIWGAWLPLLWPYLSGARHFEPEQIGWMFAVGAIGAILAPFIAGQLADRYFSTEKFLAVSHLIGGVLIWQLASLTEYWQFLVFSLLYSIVYSPTMPLTNSLAFHHLPDRDRDFGRVRVWGTVGWIAVGIGMGHWLFHMHTPATENGVIAAVQPGQLVLNQPSGSQTVLAVGNSVPVTIGKPVRFNDLKPGQIVVATLDSKSKVTAINASAGNNGGKLESVSPGHLMLQLRSGERAPYEVSVSPAVSVDGKQAKLEELKPGQLIVVTTDTKVTAIRGSSAKKTQADHDELQEKGLHLSADQSGGSLVSVSPGALVLKLQSGERQVYEVSDSPSVSIDGKQAALEDLKPGQLIVATLDTKVAAIRGLSAKKTQADLDELQEKDLQQPVIQAAQERGMSDAFKLSAILGIAMGLFCFALPHTPPVKGKEKNASVEALGEIRHNPLLMLFLLAVPISCIHQFYFVHAAKFINGYQSAAGGFVDTINTVFGVGGAGLMTIGQMSELFVLALMPLAAKRFSRKTLLAAGIIAYGLRMFLFAYASQLATATGLSPLVFLIPGLAMHGFCFGCFIFVAFMVVDEETTGDVRASAQSLFNLVIIGVGIIVGSVVAGWVAKLATEKNPITGAAFLNYTKLFEVPMWAAVACLVVLLLFYPRRGRRAASVR